MDLMDRRIIRKRVEILRNGGKTYREIQKKLGVRIPKSTLSFWCKNIDLPNGYADQIGAYNKFNLEKARKIALAIHKKKRNEYLRTVARPGY